MGLQAVGGWIFLRFLNPAIISPEMVDLEIPEDSKAMRRILVFMSKVGGSTYSQYFLHAEKVPQLLQALSNNVRFKEPGMRPMNSFIERVSKRRSSLVWRLISKQHILDMTTFLLAISVSVGALPSDPRLTLMVEIVDGSQGTQRLCSAVDIAAVSL